MPNSTEMTHHEEVSDAQLAQWWLEFGITRKITKRNCMCEEKRNKREIPQYVSETKQARN